ncbi:hypothetical protein [Ewingella americana]|uniref:Uncharacterized protein n=1 Tax=Ewingella americana TaxID=41202 RepID=A0A502GDI3_9GAMM|nr:hypothetical protein [Ewingella americana]TPG59924.1 hypothetical protein EAH77_15265 [Ewingella americana]
MSKSLRSLFPQLSNMLFKNIAKASPVEPLNPTWNPENKIGEIPRVSSSIIEAAIKEAVLNKPD